MDKWTEWTALNALRWGRQIDYWPDAWYGNWIKLSRQGSRLDLQPGDWGVRFYLLNDGWWSGLTRERIKQLIKWIRENQNSRFTKNKRYKFFFISEIYLIPWKTTDLVWRKLRGTLVKFSNWGSSLHKGTLQKFSNAWNERQAASLQWKNSKPMITIMIRSKSTVKLIYGEHYIIIILCHCIIVSMMTALYGSF